MWKPKPRAARDHWDGPEYEEWLRSDPVEPSKLLKISANVFDEKGGLVIYTANQWDLEWISLTDYQPPSEEAEPGPDSQGITDDNVPF